MRRSAGEVVQLRVPPDCGNGKLNAGISLARLLWHVPVPALCTLIASMLLERHVLIVGQSRDMVSSAVQAAAALLYPFQCVAGCPAAQAFAASRGSLSDMRVDTGWGGGRLRAVGNAEVGTALGDVGLGT